MRVPLVVIGLDGATLDLTLPWAAEGRLPVLDALMRRGAWARLRSTTPPATFPAWTSLVTGVNPGRHGVLDFTERVPGTYRVRFVNGSHRRMPALWTRVSAMGRRAAVVTVPGTYPPEVTCGVMVSGWDSPLTTAIDGSFVHPRAFYDELRHVVGRLPFADFQEVTTGPGWHARALASLVDGIDRRARLTRHLAERERWDLLMVVFGESDTVAHHFWRWCDPASPRFARSAFGDAILRVYRALDAALGQILAAAPPDAVVAVVSDHGSGGASDMVVHLNRRLAQCGLLEFDRTPSPLGSWLRGATLAVVPAALQGGLLRRLPVTAGRVESLARFGGVTWRGTRAFSDELDYHPSVWLNVRGREPEGTVALAEYERTRDAVIAALTSWRYEDGRPVVARAWRRENLLAGPYVERAPDVLVELALVDGYSPSCLRSGGAGPAVRRLAPHEHGGGKGAGMSGAHRPDGLLVLAGTGVRPVGEIAGCHVTDVVPTLLAAAGVPIPHGLDGSARTSALVAEPTYESDGVPPPGGPAVSYDAAT
ncbi:MAG: alkaline phosphatase family protein, partial [Candidatus Binatia bacterium]